MKIAFLTTTFENTTNGPAKFARLLYQFTLVKSKKIVFITEDIKVSNDCVKQIIIPKWLDIPGIGLFYRMLKFYSAVNKIQNVSTVVSNNTMYSLFFNLFSKKKIIGFINDNEHLKRTNSFSYSSIRSLIFFYLEKYNYKRNSITIVNSEYLKNEIEVCFGKSQHKLKVLYKGIIVNEELNLDKHYDDDIFRILFVKTNYSIGGLETLLKAVKTNSKVHLDIVTSENIYSDGLFKLLDCANFSYKLYHNLDQIDVFYLMKKSHCVCIPSKVEALGVANMEGMLHSCIIISSDVGGIPEVLDNGRVGIMIENYNYLALKERIEYTHKNREFRIMLVKKAHSHVQKFSIENTFNIFFDIINE